MSEQARSSGGPGFKFGVLVGGLMGAALGVLLAPRPGREMRERLAEQAEAVRDRGFGGFDEQIAELRESIAEVREILREAVAEGREVLREAVAEGRRASVETQHALRQEYLDQTRPDGDEPEKKSGA